MPEEAIINQPASPQNEIKEAPNLDSELDAALSKQFANRIEKPQEKVLEKPIAPVEVKKESVKDPSQIEIKLDSKKKEKPIENEKPVLSPEEVDKMDPKRQDGWTAIKNSNKRAHGMIQDRDQEISKLKAALAEKGSMSQKELEALKAEKTDLEKYRAMIDIQADPEFISKFDQPIEKVVDSIKGLFKTIRDKTTGQPISDDIINAINFTDTRTVDSILEHIEGNGDKTTAKRIQRKIEELVDLSDQRDETLSSQKDNYKEFLESKKKENFSKESEGEGRALKHIENISIGKDKEGNQKYNPIPFLNKMSSKEGADQAEIDYVNNHNHMVDLMSQKVQEVIKMKSPEERAETAVAAVASHYLNAKLKAADAKIKSLEEELKKISVVRDETVKSKTTPTRKNGSDMDLDSALSSHFAASR